VSKKLVRATVLVRLKAEVLDPQGRAVERALAERGFAAVRGVRIGKLIELELEVDPGQSEPLEKRLARMADELFANPVIEDYEIVVGPRRS
jgi:phosphoribosylformylglycinamidine synthase subunit PurS